MGRVRGRRTYLIENIRQITSKGSSKDIACCKLRTGFKATFVVAKPSGARCDLGGLGSFIKWQFWKIVGCSIDESDWSSWLFGNYTEGKDLDVNSAWGFPLGAKKNKIFKAI